MKIINTVLILFYEVKAGCKSACKAEVISKGQRPVVLVTIYNVRAVTLLH